METWEGNVAGRIGLGVAIDYALAWGLGPIRRRVSLLADDLRARLAEIPGLRLRDLGIARCGIVSFEVAGRDAPAMRVALAREGINIETSSAAATRLDMTARGLDCLLRASVHYYNTEDEVARFGDAVATLCAEDAR